MPQAGHPSGMVSDGAMPVLEFGIIVFLPSLILGFSHEIMVPAVTATIIAVSNDFESFMYLNYSWNDIFFDDNNTFKNVAKEELYIFHTGVKKIYVC